MGIRRMNGVVDTALIFKAAGLIDASAACTPVIDVGAGRFTGQMIIDVSALEIASNTEIYDLVIQGTNVAAFATDTDIWDLMSLQLAAAEVKTTDANGDSIVGRYIMRFTNELAGTFMRYLRMYTIVGGTVATGINYTAHAVKD